MAVTYDEMKKMLDSQEIKYTHKTDEGRERIVFSWGTDNYVDTDGDKSLVMVISLEENGEYFKLISPSVYNYKEGPCKAQLFQALLMVCWKTKLVEFEYDENDGEIRMIIEFPIEDGTITEKQLRRCIKGMLHIVEEYHPVIDKVIKEGVIDFSLQKSGEVSSVLEGLSTDQVAEQFMAFLRERMSADSPESPDSPQPSGIGMEE